MERSDSLRRACALSLPPIEESRDPKCHRRYDWLYLTMGPGGRQVFSPEFAGKDSRNPYHNPLDVSADPR
jgi:hypothetical protein